MLPPIETIGAWGSKIVIVTTSGLSIIDNAGGNRTDISPWMSDVPPASYATIADRLFLVSPPTAGGQSTTLYVSDGTAAGTMAVNVPGLASIDGPLTVVGDDVVFPGTDIFGQQALFSSNGVTAGSEEIQLPAGLTLTNSNWIAALPDVNPPGTLSLGSGSQTYVAAPGTIVQPGSGSDTITASSGNVTVLGAGGKLTFYGGTAPSLVEGGSASSTIFGGAGGGRFTGGTAGHNILVSQGASGANTTLNGGGAGDRIFGSAEGNDMLTGATGRESILGGAGNTTINGGSAADVVFAGSGNTIVYAGTAGADTIVGGAGVTNIIAQKGDAIFGSTGALLVSGSMTGADSIAGGAGSLTVAGRGGNMLVVASTGSSVINTGNGASLIFAGSGTVAVNGGAGSLQVLLGSGNSTITEGTGAARYDLVKGSGGSSDVINGFRPGTDILDLYGYQASDQQITGGGSTVVSLSDGTTITLAGVTNAGSSIIG